ncbi:MAG TPA: hypothetical protein VFP72_20305 [Kineosporiaceae bacterium]|nr:hypothetical protein [Kineosporiaceae bacterium]
MLLKRAAITLATAVVLVGASMATGSPSQAKGNAQSQANENALRDARNAEIIAYQDAHPDDLVGLDALARKYTGRGVKVAFSGTNGTLNASQAQAHLKAWQASKTSSPQVKAAATPVGMVKPMALPNDTFAVWIVQTPLMGPPAQWRYNGRWDFKDTFAGQSSPVDVASLSFDMPSCMRMVGHSISTFSVTGTNTYLGSLRSANVAAKAPIWNIADRTSGFQNLADRGSAGVTVQKYCTESTQVGADFAYEFNQGGGLFSVTAGWGLLEVSYTGSDQHLQKGTAPIYDVF